MRTGRFGQTGTCALGVGGVGGVRRDFAAERAGDLRQLRQGLVDDVGSVAGAGTGAGEIEGRREYLISVVSFFVLVLKYYRSR